MSTELIKSENVALVISDAPMSYQFNIDSHDKCIKAGEAFICTIEAEGMSDELDIEVKKYLDRARKTLTLMNERRSPITKMFDEMRRAFTSLENDVDLTKQGTIPCRLQELRNEYAARKKREEDARRQEEERKLRLETAAKQYPLDVAEYVKRTYNAFLEKKIAELLALNASITLENFDERKQMIEAYPYEISLSQDIPENVVRTELDADSAKKLRMSVMIDCNKHFAEQYKFEIESNKESILEMLPSKRRELEEIARAGEEEKAKRIEEMKKREAEETSRLEMERARKEAEEKERLKAEQANVNMGALFSSNSVAAANDYQPKVSVKKKIVVTAPQGILELVNLWWVSEGCKLSVEELAKKFKSQITYCEKLANDKADPKTIDSPYVRYDDDVKAK